MGLFRTAIVVAAVVALMSTDRNQQAQVYDKAAAAAKWTVTFCDRNAEACKQGGEMWATFVKKAQFAGQMAVQLIQEQAASRTGSPGDAPPKARRHDAASRNEVPLFERREQSTERDDDVPLLERREARQDAGTLRQDDMRPEWRGRDQQRQPRRGY